MYKIAVMGDRDSIYGFAAVGLDIYPVADAGRAAKQLRRLVEAEYAIIYMTESLCDDLAAELEEYQDKMLPAIIPIPGVANNTGLGMARVKKSVEQAVGADILFGDNE